MIPYFSFHVSILYHQTDRCSRKVYKRESQFKSHGNGEHHKHERQHPGLYKKLLYVLHSRELRQWDSRWSNPGQHQIHYIIVCMWVKYIGQCSRVYIHVVIFCRQNEDMYSISVWPATVAQTGHGVVKLRSFKSAQTWHGVFKLRSLLWCNTY